MANLKNINFMSKTKFDSVTPSDDELYFVDFGDIDFVVESYNSGTDWYRVYKSGWIEQGGYINGSGTVTITFKKPYKNTNYTITGGLVAGTSSASYEHMNFTNLTTTGFQFIVYDSYKCKWYACGQGA